MIRAVPFYPNTDDDNHCYEASLRMVLKYFLPEKEYTWAELDQLTGKRPGYWTWPTQALLSLKDMGFDVLKLDLFDYEQFIERGNQYLIEIYGKEGGQAQIDYSDIGHEIEVAKKYITSGIHKIDVPTLTDVKRLLDEGYLLILNVNARAFNGLDGYLGHFIVVYGYDDSSIHYHDPGLPPMEAQQRPFAEFLAGWEAGYPDAKNLQAIAKYQGK